MGYFTRLSVTVRDILSCEKLNEDQKAEALDLLIQAVYGESRWVSVESVLSHALDGNPNGGSYTAYKSTELFNPRGLSAKILVQAAKHEYDDCHEFMMESARSLNTLIKGTGIVWDGTPAGELEEVELK